MKRPGAQGILADLAHRALPAEEATPMASCTYLTR